MSTPERVVLVDGSAIVFRAWFALPGSLQNSDGLKTNAIYGFANMFRKMFAGKTPTRGAVIFDAPGRTFRDEKFPDYKADRPPMDNDLKKQLPYIDEVVRTNGFPILKVSGYEADDVIGTLAKEAAALGHEVHIYSGDKDFCQLIDDRVRMIDAIRDITYDAELVRKKWGVPPSQFVDLLALMGDSIDNIPGVPGIGKKGAAGLLERFGDLETILASTDQLKGRQQANLREFAEQARLCQELATIDCAVPLDVGVEDLVLPPWPEGDVNTLYTKLQFYSLITEAAREELAGDVAEANYGTVWVKPALTNLVEWLAGSEEPVAIHPVFDVEGVPWSDLVGLAVTREAQTGWFLPFHGPGEVLGIDALEVLRPWLEDPAAPKVAHDWKRLWVALMRHGIDAQGCVFDLRLASFLSDPTRLIPHRLGQLTKDVLHRVLLPAKGLVGSGKKLIPFSQADTAELTGWAGHLVSAVHEMWVPLRDRCEQAGMTELLQEHELPLSHVLGRMELRGIRVDADDLRVLGDEFRVQREKHQSAVWEAAGREFNLGSPKQLGEVLFDAMGLPVIKRTKTGYSTNVEVLERLSKKGHGIADSVLAWRSVDKLINTYTDVLSAAVQPDGRIHTRFQQTTGATGRLITTDPDLQRTPISTPEGRRIRQAFVADPGWRIISADWSQIELRILAHVSGDPALVEAFTNGWDIHARTAAGLFDVPREAVTRAQRNIGKTVNFATIYGQGATALGQILDIERKAAKGFIDRYFATYAGVKEWLDRTKEEALRDGSVLTMLGRRRTIPELTSNSQMARMTGLRMAANTPIQGSAADLCKMVMLEIPQRLEAAGLQTQMLLQIHDELVFEAPEAEVDASVAIVRSAMESAVELEVPLVVDVGVGASWSAAH
ncbi:MAG: DNA polymerase I [Deltaproteobacteria bacterium]|nr:DNA polymerase I [Deltaproteobacteria bacterium]